MVFGQQLFQRLESNDGQPMEYEWKIFPGFTAVGILNQIQQMMGELQCEPETSQARPSSCQCLTTLYGM